MTTRYHRPAWPLSEFIELFWYYQGYTQPHQKERLLPEGAVSLVINLHDDETRIYDKQNPSICHRYSGNIVCGPHSEPFIIDTAEQFCVLGIYFKVGGAAPFLGLPLNEAVNQHVELESLWGAESRRLRCRLLESPTIETKFELIESLLLARAKGRMDASPAVRYAVHEFSAVPQTRTIASVSEQMGYSSRHFINLFRRHVGLTPKVYCRVRRFQEILQRLHRRQALRWPELALDCGYFDQAHFIHDFKAFSGINPTTYVQLRTEHKNHVPLPE